MKELWIETSLEKKQALEPLVSQFSDWVVEEDKATFLVNKKNITLDIFSPKKAEKLEKINVYKKIVRICISDKETENQIVEASELGATYLIISCANWRVIPLENLIARIKGKSKLIAEVTNAEEAKVALETLELGTDGVLLKTSRP